MAVTVTRADVVATLPYQGDRIGVSGERIDDDELDGWISAAQAVIDGYLAGSGATVGEAEDLIEQAIIDYAAARVIEALGHDASSRWSRWQEAKTAIQTMADQTGAAVDTDAVATSNAGAGAAGDFTSGTSGDFRGF